MNLKSLSLLGAVILAATVGGRAHAAESPATCVRVIDLQVDPTQLDAFSAALKTEAAAALQEPGVLGLYASAEKDHPDHIHLFELYADDAAYKAHQAGPAFAHYKAATSKMIRSRKIAEMVPVYLGAK